MSRSSSRTLELLAAVDLGSNSFHCVVAQLVDGRIDVIEHQRESVRLASGMSRDGRLSDAAVTRALECLDRFGACLRDRRPERVRAVGTHALRSARGIDPFLERASGLLGVPIDIVSGVDEARLIYLGVANHRCSLATRQLVIDVGGGSTEVALGRGAQPDRLQSIPVGCVTLSERFFASDEISLQRMMTAREVVRHSLRPLEEAREQWRWDAAIASSGSFQTIRDALREYAPEDPMVSRAAMAALLNHAVKVGDLRELKLNSLEPERRRLFGGGLAILLEIFDLFAIDRLAVSDRAMRDGVLFELSQSASSAN